MRRRFGRGRRGRGGAAAESRAAPIDAERALARMIETGVAGARSLEPLEEPGVPDHFAALGRGEGASGPLLVAFSPRHGGDAALAALTVGLRLAEEEGFDGEVLALAPHWSDAARRRLGLLSDGPTPRLRTLAATALADDPDARVGAESQARPAVVTLRQASAAVLRSEDRELFQRASASLEGLAAKHGGALRGCVDGAELVLLTRVSVRLRCDGGVHLETLLPDRSSARLAPGDLANALDRLEGSLRKRLNDGRIRGSEEGLRGQLWGVLARAGGLRASVPWPLSGSDPEVLDVAGIARDGVPAVGAVRAELDLPGLAAILDAAATLRPALPLLLSEADPPLRFSAPRLLLAASEFDPAVARVLPHLGLEVAAYDVATQRGREPGLVPRTLEAAAPAPVAARAEAAPRGEAAEAPREAPAAPEPRAEDKGPEAPRRRFEEVSLFDLDEERGSDTPSDSGGGRRRRRGRRRRGGRRGAGSEGAPGSDDEDADPAREPQSQQSRRAAERRRPPEPPEEEEQDEEEALDDLDLSATLAALSGDVPDLDEMPELGLEAEVEPRYDDDEDEDEEDEQEEAEEIGGAAGLRREREERLKERMARATPAPEPEAAAPRAPRRRAALVAHADRESLLAAILLARDLRLVEGFWVYPQSELMTFFRSVATDLREETPICVVGFSASPARDTIQAASLYAGRLDWYDHHVWPPEDLEALRAAIGRERVVVHPQAGSSLPAVLAARSRRSRFSDKLVELATASFSHHDYERWGRLWWHRLGEIAARPGERRPDIEPLLVGRPSELARNASRAPTPPPPPEVEEVSRRDFRLVHFGGYTLVVVPVPAELDLHLTGRVARERYGATLSVAHREGGELVVLAGEEARGRHGLDLGRMAQHLAAKHAWIETLPDSDHVARLLVRDLAARPERLDDVIGEIAMGRSILEG